MTRKYFDYREHAEPDSTEQCSVAISADTDDEVVEATVDHAVQVHGYEDTPELRDMVKSGIKEGSPRA
jgi:predicted small metal-binding protein